MKINLRSFLSVFGFTTLIFVGHSFSQKKGTEIKLESNSFKRMIDNTIEFSIPLKSVEELHSNMDDYILLDAREKKEYDVSHLPNAIHVGYDDPDMALIASLDKSKKLLFYCSIGYRSEKMGEKAKDLGFEEVYNLYGSIFEWANKGYELEGPDGQPTKKIHGYSWIWGRWIL